MDGGVAAGAARGGRRPRGRGRPHLRRRRGAGPADGRVARPAPTVPRLERLAPRRRPALPAALPAHDGHRQRRRPSRR